MQIQANVKTTALAQVTEPRRPRVKTAGAPDQTQARHRFYNQALAGIDALRGHAGQDFGSIRNAISDVMVQDKTGFDLRDNETGRTLKSEYRDLYNRSREAQQTAQALADRYGCQPGLHKLPNGDRVEVVRNEDGSATVTTFRQDGSQTVAELSKDPGQFRQTDTSPRGEETVVERDGTRVREGNTEYSLGANGLPERHVNNRPFGSYTTRINPDSSTDTTSSVMCQPPTVKHEPPGPGFRGIPGL